MINTRAVMRALEEQRDESLTNWVIEHVQVKVAVTEKNKKWRKIKTRTTHLLGINGN